MEYLPKLTIAEVVVCVERPISRLYMPSCYDNILRIARELEKKRLQEGLLKYQLHLNNAKCNLRLLFCLKSTKLVIKDIENVIINFMMLNAYPPKVIEPPKPLDHDDLYD